MSGFIDFGARTVGCDPKKPDLVRVDKNPGIGQYAFFWLSGAYEVNCDRPWLADRAPALGSGRFGAIETIYSEAAKKSD